MMHSSFFDIRINLALIARAFIFGGLLLWSTQTAFSEEVEIDYPLAELGDCADRTSCRTYCDNQANRIACTDFALKHRLISKAEADSIKTALKKTERGKIGRGDLIGSIPATRPQKIERVRGPKSIRSGETRIDEAKATRLIAEVGGPGGCDSFESCGEYCENPENSKSCFAYAKKHGLMEAKDLARFEKMIDASGPGGCRGRACEAYCAVPGHEKECLAFAKEHDLIDREEVEKFEKLLDIEGPGGCRGRECEAYCGDPEHAEACMQFAIEQGFMSEEDFQEMNSMRERFEDEYEDEDGDEEEDEGEENRPAALKEPEGTSRDMGDRRPRSDFRGRGGPGSPTRPSPRMMMDGSERMMKDFSGPGGCKGVECAKYCVQPENQEECAKYARPSNNKGERPPELEGRPKPNQAEGLIRHWLGREEERPGLREGSPDGQLPPGVDRVLERFVLPHLDDIRPPAQKFEQGLNHPAQMPGWQPPGVPGDYSAPPSPEWLTRPSADFQVPPALPSSLLGAPAPIPPITPRPPEGSVMETPQTSSFLRQFLGAVAQGLNRRQ